ncbi:lamin tail domain-containing protein [Candidatus Roizmanbacteria bacterium]|nr:lamin tail domain-containing protein [Candidatus Roizmanbacteria bacterium]
MKKLPVLPLLFFVLTTGFVSYRITFALFSDSATSTGNVFSASTEFPTPTPQIAQVLVINEVLPDSSCTVGGGPAQKEAQWIEVYNGYSTAVGLQDFKITDGTNTIAIVNGNVQIDPGEFVLLSHDNSIWQGNPPCYNNNGADTANLGGTLNIDTGSLQLLDSGNTVIDTVQWGGATGLNPAQDQSIERDPDGLDSATGTNFNASDFVVRTTPAPGL